MSTSKFNCGKYCGGKRFKGFSDAKMATAPLMLAIKAVRDRDCGVALEALGRGKALLTGRERRSPQVQRTIKFVETACPKSRFVAVRSDVVDALKLAPGTELPSTWGKSVQNMMQGRLRKPKARKVWDKKRHAYVWRQPSKREIDIYEDLAFRHRLVARSKHPAAGSRSMRSKIAPRHKRRGEAVKRGRGRPKKR